MRFLIILLFFLSLLTACSLSKDARLQELVDSEANARTFMQAGNYTAAAVEYLSLAAKDKQNALVYRLKAVTAYIEAGGYAEAEKILSTVTVPKNQPLQNIRMKILSARTALELGQPVKALAWLDRAAEKETPPGLKATFHDLRARAYLAHGDNINAISERVRRSSYLNTPTEIEQNNRSLWQILEVIPEAKLDAMRMAAPSPLTAWFELASLYQTYRFQPARLSDAVGGWIQRYPGHPAYPSITQALLDKSMQYVNQPTKIGLLLPLSGTYQKSAMAIRDGLLAAWYMDNRREKPTIAIYDADALNIIDVYQQAINAGVDYIVGPLEKAAIGQLAQQDLSVQVLALNRQALNSEQVHDRLIQFGLSPEDEAAQIADIARSDGHQRALVMTPENPWGDRMADAFMQRWVELGGVVLERARFQSNAQDFAAPVKSLLNIDSSERRGQALRNILNINLHYVERRREDADFIFIVAAAGDAHQLLPQFRFHRAGDLPVYATSHIFTGVVDKLRDADLNDVMFIGMPWILDTARQLSIIQDALNRNWSQEKSQYRHLYALGIDAYHLIPEMGRLSTDKYSVLAGETGDLTITPDNIVRRKLSRAQFVGGQPVLLH